MYKLSFFIFFLLNKIISSTDLINNLQSYQNLKNFDKTKFYDNYYFNEIIDNLVEEFGLNYEDFLNNSLSENCIDMLNNTFFNNNSFLYYKKLFFDSSFNIDDVYSYYDCIDNKNFQNEYNFTYLTISINDGKSLYNLLLSNEGSTNYLFGLCIIDGCNNAEYQEIIKKAMGKLNIIKSSNDNNSNNYSYNNIISDTINNINDSSNYENINNNPKIQIFSLKENNDTNGFIIFLELLPVIIFILHLFFIIFNNIPIYLYNFFIYIFCCKSNKRIPLKTSNYVVKKKDKKSTSKQVYKAVDSDRNPSNASMLSNVDNFQKSINLLYNINQNFSSLTVYKKQSEITNDSGLSYINGIKGVSMIFYLFGSVYSALYSSFSTEKKRTNFYNNLKSIYFSIFYIGIKYAPKLLLCASGFSLFFKFICFLDGKVENEEEINRQKEESLSNDKDIKEKKNTSNNSNSFFQKLKKSGDREKINKNNLISFNYALAFFGMQLHKYIVYILFMCLILFSLNRIVSLIQKPKTIWPFFNETMINSAKDVSYLLPLLIGYQSYFIPKILNNKDDNILDYLYLVFQEIIYFIITTLVIFIGYKKNLRIDRFFKLIFLALLIFRFVFYFMSNLDDKDYFGPNEYGKFYNSLLYNYTFYIIGIHFGMINYVIQKGYSFREIGSQNKIYLIHSLRMLKNTKRKNKNYLYVIAIISGFFLIINSFLQQIILLFYSFEKINIKYSKNIFSQIIMLLDADFFVLAFNLMALFLYIKGDNLVNNILCHNFWSIFNRFYFSYILLINPIILYVIYVNETKIIFNISNCFLYSFICGILVFSLAIFIYITFELPFKKIIHFWIKLTEKVVMKERLSHLEATYSYGQEQYLLDSATGSISDFIDDEEEEEEN